MSFKVYGKNTYFFTPKYCQFLFKYMYLEFVILM
jgi:hypothetical protein